MSEQCTVGNCGEPEFYQVLSEGDQTEEVLAVACWNMEHLRKVIDATEPGRKPLFVRCVVPTCSYPDCHAMGRFEIVRADTGKVVATACLDGHLPEMMARTILHGPRLVRAIGEQE